jgi:hypothetical protein
MMSMLGLTPLATNGGAIELVQGLLHETSPGKNASGNRKRTIATNMARLMDCSSNFDLSLLMTFTL